MVKWNTSLRKPETPYMFFELFSGYGAATRVWILGLTQVNCMREDVLCATMLPSKLRKRAGFSCAWFDIRRQAATGKILLEARSDQGALFLM